MRSIFERKNVSINCELFSNRKKIHGILMNLSEVGCRIQIHLADQKYLQIGSIAEVSAKISDTSDLNFIAFIINKSSDYVGFTFCSIDEFEYVKLTSFLNQKSLPTELGMKVVPSDKKGRVLFLGPGGGKILGQIRMCKYLEEVLGVRLYDYFDHFVGVSSGGLVCALILKYKSLDLVEKKVLEFNFFPKLNFLLFQGLVSKKILFQNLRKEFNHFEFENDSKSLHLQARNYKTGIMHTLNLSDNRGNVLVDFIQKSVSIPTIFGITNGFVDGAVGGFLNPTELFLRNMRMKFNKTYFEFCLYLDAGFDPVVNSDFFSENTLNQLFWVLKVSQRDNLFLSIDRILSEFPNSNFFSYFFSYTNELNLLKVEDLFKSVFEIETKKKFFQDWLKDIIP